MYGFTIRGQEYRFNSREAYLEAFSRSLDIADAQMRKEPPPDEQLELPLYKPPIGIELPQLEG